MHCDRNQAAALDSEIAHLRGLALTGLRARWRTCFGRTAPAHLTRHLLLRLLAYRIQAEALGDLDPATVRALDRIAGSEARARSPQPAPRRVRPGTLLVREWGGVPQRVMAQEEGFVWNGATFKSLSQVARAITGTRWNGPRFFGLREPSRPRQAGAGA
jgi:hypothetical protein